MAWIFSASAASAPTLKYGFTAPLHRHRGRHRAERVVAPDDHLPERHRRGLVLVVQPPREARVHHRYWSQGRPTPGRRRGARQAHVEVLGEGRPAVEKRPDAAVDDGAPVNSASTRSTGGDTRRFRRRGPPPRRRRRRRRRRRPRGGGRGVRGRGRVVWRGSRAPPGSVSRRDPWACPRLDRARDARHPVLGVAVHAEPSRRFASATTSSPRAGRDGACAWSRRRRRLRALRRARHRVHGPRGRSPRCPSWRGRRGGTCNCRSGRARGGGGRRNLSGSGARRGSAGARWSPAARTMRRWSHRPRGVM